MKTGKIRIKDKVYFEYYESPKPNRLNYPFAIFTRKHYLTKISYKKAMVKHEASKQLIEVVNDYDQNSIKIKGIELRHWYKDNQKCKAEITNNRATIIELIKEKDSYKKRT